MRPAGLRAVHFAWRGWILAALLGALAWARFRSHAPLQPGGLALLAAGLAWRAWAGFHIAAHSNGAALSGASLAAGGPYRISRHPLYFANLLCAAGIILYAHCLPLWAVFAALAAAAAHHEALARAEEGFLLERHGAAYLGYMQVTPRWPWIAKAGGGRAGQGPADPARAAAGRAGTGSAGGGGGIRGVLFGWRSVLARQGWNLAKGCACALIIRIAAAAG